MPKTHLANPLSSILKQCYARKQKEMNQTAKIAIALFAAFAVVGAVAAVAELSTPAFATTKHHDSNNQQNFQGAFNFNNQQFKSNFQCEGCNP